MLLETFLPRSLSGHVDMLTLPLRLRLQTLDLQNVVGGFAKMTKADIQVALNAGIKNVKKYLELENWDTRDKYFVASKDVSHFG